MAERATEQNLWLQPWLGLKLGDHLLMYMLRKVIPKFQLREILGAKVVFGRPVSYLFVNNDDATSINLDP
jgi:hypothetical protein